MSHEQLVVFSHAAETLNFSETARRLYLSQPTVSQSIKQLEHEYGARLFERGKQLRLTPAGETLYPYALHIREELEAANQAMQALKGTIAGPLKLGASTTIGSYWLPRVLVDLKRRYPLVEPSLIIENSANLLEKLYQGSLHLLLVEGPYPHLKDARFQVKPFQEDQLVLVASPHFNLPNPLEPQALCKLPWILREPGSGTRDVLMEYLEARNLLPINIFMQLGGTEAIKRAVREGAGVACVSQLAVQEDLDAGRLCQLEVKDWLVRRTLWAVHPLERYLSPAAKAVLESIR